MVPLLAVGGYYAAEYFFADEETPLMELSANCDPVAAPCTLSDEIVTATVAFDGDALQNHAFTLLIKPDIVVKSVTVGLQNGSLSEGLSRPIPASYDADTEKWKLDVELAEDVRGVESWTLLLVLTHDSGGSFGEIPFIIRAKQ